TRGDRVMIPVPLYHMYGFGAAFLPAIIAGASVHLLENTNIIKYLEGENQFKPNISFMTPVLCEMSTRTRKGSYPYRAVVTAGDRINKTAFETFEQRFGRLVNLYGSTELGAIATSNLSDPLDTRSDGIVQPMPGVDIRLKGTGVSGLVCIHDSGFETYVDKHGTPIPPDPRTGFDTKDLAKIIDPQRFKVVGRTGNSINRNGILVAFSEVESLMEQGIEDVQYAIVVTNEEESARGRKLAAYCQLKPRTGAHSTGKDIRSRCFDIMLRHMVPDKVVVMEEIPRLPNGKFDRKKLANLS
ncbi:MAG: acyl--CoA ligase, partial [bacterium]|nr:acyl--CoA ligase [bacterium]